MAWALIWLGFRAFRENKLPLENRANFPQESEVHLFVFRTATKTQKQSLQTESYVAEYISNSLFCLERLISRCFRSLSSVRSTPCVGFLSTLEANDRIEKRTQREPICKWIWKNCRTFGQDFRLPFHGITPKDLMYKPFNRQCFML